MSADDRIFLWEVGATSGTAGSRDDAFSKAAPCLAAGAEGLVEEARVVMAPAGPAGSIPEHRRTGKRWRGLLVDGEPSWEQAARPAAQAR